MKKISLSMMALVCLMMSCDVVKQLQGTASMVNCKYDFRSLTDISVAGINVSQGLTLLDAPKILGLLTGSTKNVPVVCTVNLNVQNPNATAAMLNGMDFRLAIDGVNFTSGSVAKTLSVEPGATGVLPLAMTFDVATLLKGETRDAVVGVVRNLVSLSGLTSLAGGAASQVTLDIRPSFSVGGYPVASPVYIPVSFSFGGK